MQIRSRAKALVLGAAATVLVAGLAVPTQAAPQAPTAANRPGDGLSQDDRATLQRYAEGTWASFVAMTDEASGMPADKLKADGTASAQTSTTNIGAYLWSAVVAEELGIIGRDELVDRLAVTLDTLAGLERHEESGQFFNWYDHRTGEVITTWPDDGSTIVPHLSSVDNGWLATGLQVVREAVPELAQPAGELFDSMDFGFYYRPEVNRILFHYAPSTGAAPCCYDTLVSESRIATYIGIAKGELPRETYFGTWRSFPDTCDWSWQQSKPVGEWRTYLRQDVWEGAYQYRGLEVVPGWGGSMFEALMPSLFVPEEEWGRRSWAVNHPNTVQAHIEHGMEEAQYGYWGFSPSNNTEGGYNVYGVPLIGMDPNGYPSNNDDTRPDPGFEGCREGRPLPGPEEYTNGVVTPHATFLALRYAPEEAMENLANLERDFDIYSGWGFRDAVNVDTGAVDEYFLSLDQGMIMGAIGNALADDLLRDAFVTPRFQSRVKPVIAMEEFTNYR
ncbi:glucoamylase family protein [Jiangella endophytica]|uniref:glucoamylase family protein n=1 Tax=Jiangella endophytica TaxID=1623398 RepID=UPI000E344C19|nr:glucoamylase family protein [Jiangella endophytica]